MSHSERRKRVHEAWGKVASAPVKGVQRVESLASLAKTDSFAVQVALVRVGMEGTDAPPADVRRLAAVRFACGAAHPDSGALMLLSRERAAVSVLELASLLGHWLEIGCPETLKPVVFAPHCRTVRAVLKHLYGNGNVQNGPDEFTRHLR